ncbi:hypothetical protein HPP92_028787 [Vanilla planifolia]|uniref:Uncharacterized protein n=1 Tax=Vanilla planifolia TaxID=51239 RepID=A0A835P798_VANPL|nr:hypothetical protein HPP92_028787 [Vanilla planifolia]KAG0446552.1 hypothetical protein HPP92_028776 [Vanilla planifolia]
MRSLSSEPFVLVRSECVGGAGFVPSHKQGPTSQRIPQRRKEESGGRGLVQTSRFTPEMAEPAGRRYTWRIRRTYQVRGSRVATGVMHEELQKDAKKKV